MARPRTSKLDKLLTEMRRRGSMTHKEMVQFLLRGTGNRYNETTRKYYDGVLYNTYGATRTRYGLLGNFCQKNADGTWSVSDWVSLPAGRGITDSVAW